MPKRTRRDEDRYNSHVPGDMSASEGAPVAITISVPLPVANSPTAMAPALGPVTLTVIEPVRPVPATRISRPVCMCVGNERGAVGATGRKGMALRKPGAWATFASI